MGNKNIRVWMRIIIIYRFQPLIIKEKQDTYIQYNNFYTIINYNDIDEEN